MEFFNALQRGLPEGSSFTVDEEGDATFVVHLDDGRKQEMTVESFDISGRHYFRVCTTFGKPGQEITPKMMKTALELNASLLHGCFALAGSRFVMTAVLEPDDPAHAATVVAYVAKTADNYEKMAFGLDRG